MRASRVLVLPSVRGLQTGAAAILLAAGAGRRFGASAKQLTELEGRPLLQHALDALLALQDLDPVTVVLGARAEEVRRGLLLGRAKSVVCADWASGMSASLRTGVESVSDAADWEWLLVALGDQPFVEGDVIRRALRLAGGSKDVDAVRPRYSGRPGHPVLIHRRLAPRLLGLRGDTGAREVLATARVLAFDAGTLLGGEDVDTHHDLDRLRNSRRGDT